MKKHTGETSVHRHDKNLVNYLLRPKTLDKGLNFCRFSLLFRNSRNKSIFLKFHEDDLKYYYFTYI